MSPIHITVHPLQHRIKEVRKGLPWYRLSDDEARHRKVWPLSDAAYRLNHHGGQYASRYTTDGVVRKADWAEITFGIKGKIPGAVNELVAAGLWHPAGAVCESKDCPASVSPAATGTWVLHDYWAYNPSAEAARLIRERNRSNGRSGGRPRNPNKTQVGSQVGTEMATHTGTHLVTRPARDPVPSRPVPVITPSPTSLSQPARRPGLGLSPETEAIIAWWAEHHGTQLPHGNQPGGIDWLENEVVSQYRVLHAAEFVAVMVEAEARATQPVKSLKFFSQWWRIANDTARDQGRSERGVTPATGRSGWQHTAVGA